MTPSTRTASNRGAIYSILAGMFVITLQDTAVKWLSPDYALHQIMFTRAVLALLITFALLRFEGGLRLVRTRRPQPAIRHVDGQPQKPALIRVVERRLGEEVTQMGRGH